MTVAAVIFLLAVLEAECSVSPKFVQKECSTYKDCISCENAKSDLLGRCVWCQKNRRCQPPINFCPEHMHTRLPYNCPRAVDAKRSQYNETFAKLVAMPMMAASKAPNDDARMECLSNHFSDVIHIRNYTAPCNLDNMTECLAFMAYLPNENAITLTFRASSLDQILPQALNFIFAKRMRTIRTLDGTVDEYYGDAFTKLWYLIDGDLKAIVRGTVDPQVWVFGHSLGGGLASIAAALISSRRIVIPERIRLVTFGQPRVTDNVFAERHDELVPYSFRIINRYDGIPLMPARMSHMQRTGPFHHRYEVWYPRGMAPGAKYLVLPLAEDGNGRSSMQLFFDIDDHKTMFGEDICEWWRERCMRHK